MPFAIGTFIISKTCSFLTVPSLLGALQLGVFPVPPPALGCTDLHGCPVPAVAPGPAEPHGCSVSRAGGVRAACPRPVSLTTRTASLGQKQVVLLLSFWCGDSFSSCYHFCFLDRKQPKIQKIPAPARTRSSSALGGIYFPAFSIALLSGSIPLHSCPLQATEQKHHTILLFHFSYLLITSLASSKS